jgi:hypothetical protein
MIEVGLTLIKETPMERILTHYHAQDKYLCDNQSTLYSSADPYFEGHFGSSMEGPSLGPQPNVYGQSDPVQQILNYSEIEHWSLLRVRTGAHIITGTQADKYRPTKY